MKTLLYLLPAVAIGFVTYLILVLVGTINFPEDKNLNISSYSKVRNFTMKISEDGKDFVQAVYFTRK